MLLESREAVVDYMTPSQEQTWLGIMPYPSFDKPYVMPPGGDPAVIARGFQRWMDAVIDGGHSVAIRWIANPFLEAYRDMLEREGVSDPSEIAIMGSDQLVRDSFGELFSGGATDVVAIPTGSSDELDATWALLSAICS